MRNQQLHFSQHIRKPLCNLAREIEIPTNTIKPTNHRDILGELNALVCIITRLPIQLNIIDSWDAQKRCAIMYSSQMTRGAATTIKNLLASTIPQDIIDLLPDGIDFCQLKDMSAPDYRSMMQYQINICFIGLGDNANNLLINSL